MKTQVLIVTAILGVALHAEIGMITKIVDGDTVHFGNTICRFANIDTPESKFNNKAERDVANCPGITVTNEVEAGRLSSNFTSSVLKVGQTYKYDVSGQDKYGRKICSIESSGQDVNLAIVSNGYAIPFYRYIDNDATLRAYTKAKMNAKRNNLGLWSSHRSVMECLDKH